MSRPLDDLQTLLGQLIDEHRKLLAETERHQVAVKIMHVADMEKSRGKQEAIRQSIGLLENRRKQLTDQIAGKMPAPTLTRLADLNPLYRTRLLALRDELRNVIGQISQRNNITSKVTNAVLGHLNTVVRLMAGAMQQAGVYTKQGVPKLAPRVGVIEAVG